MKIGIIVLILIPLLIAASKKMDMPKVRRLPMEKDNTHLKMKSEDTETKTTVSRFEQINAKRTRQQ